ncbi:unnamed protein product, partial [Brenthis ino]
MRGNVGSNASSWQRCIGRDTPPAVTRVKGHSATSLMSSSSKQSFSHGSHKLTVIKPCSVIKRGSRPAPERPSPRPVLRGAVSLAPPAPRPARLARTRRPLRASRRPPAPAAPPTPPGGRARNSRALKEYSRKLCCAIRSVNIVFEVPIRVRACEYGVESRLEAFLDGFMLKGYRWWCSVVVCVV